MNLGTIRSTLQGRLSAISGLQSYTTIPAQPQVPCVVLHIQQVNVHTALSGSDACTVRVGVQLLVQFTDWATTQNSLDSYIDTGTATSIIDALEGGFDTLVESVDGYGHVELADGVSYGTATFTTLVMT